MNGLQNRPAASATALAVVHTSPSAGPAGAGELVITPGACAFGIPLTNVDVPLCPRPPIKVTEADVYEDGVVIYAGDQPVVSFDPASAVKFAEAVIAVYRQAGAVN